MIRLARQTVSSCQVGQEITKEPCGFWRVNCKGGIQLSGGKPVAGAGYSESTAEQPGPDAHLGRGGGDG